MPINEESSLSKVDQQLFGDLLSGEGQRLIVLGSELHRHDVTSLEKRRRMIEQAARLEEIAAILRDDDSVDAMPAPSTGTAWKQATSHRYAPRLPDKSDAPKRIGVVFVDAPTETSGLRAALSAPPRNNVADAEKYRLWQAEQLIRGSGLEMADG